MGFCTCKLVSTILWAACSTCEATAGGSWCQIVLVGRSFGNASVQPAPLNSPRSLPYGNWWDSQGFSSPAQILLKFWTIYTVRFWHLSVPGHFSTVSVGVRSLTLNTEKAMSFHQWHGLMLSRTWIKSVTAISTSLVPGQLGVEKSQSAQKKGISFQQLGYDRRCSRYPPQLPLPLDSRCVGRHARFGLFPI